MRIKNQNKIDNHMRFFFFIALTFTMNILTAQESTADLSYFPKTPFNAVVVQNDTSETGTVFEKIVIDGYDDRFPFYYIQPENNPDNRCIILLHGGNGSKDTWMIARNSESNKFTRLKDSLLSLGFALIIPDMKYAGERSYELDFGRRDSLLRSGQFKKWSDYFTTTVKDVRIIMDYVESRSVGSPMTFHAVGTSMGGMITFLLNAADNRLQSVVVVVPPLILRKVSEWLGLKDTITGDKLDSIHDLFRYTNLQQSPVCLLMANADDLYTEQEAKDFFDQITVEGKIFKIYDSGHSVPDFFTKDVIEFLK
jgi:dienelactone hydrolase